jgi:hypothetical protein
LDEQAGLFGFEMDFAIAGAGAVGGVTDGVLVPKFVFELGIDRSNGLAGGDFEERGAGLARDALSEEKVEGS